MPPEAGSIQSMADFKGPSGKYSFWETELEAAQTRLRKWKKVANKTVRRFTGNAAPGGEDRSERHNGFRLNLFSSNIVTLKSMMYGNIPRVDVSRIDKTGNDDEARVAANILQHLLRNDVEENGQEYDSILAAVLEDRLIPGLGCARVRYEFREEQAEIQVIGPEGPLAQQETRTVWENAPIDYYYWDDVLWGWGRTFAELPWIGFRSYLTKDEATTRFGDKIAEQLEYKAQQVTDPKVSELESDLNSAWQKAEIWEIWHKTTKKVVWVSPGFKKILDTKPDPLQLRGFYPCPPFFMANTTTTLYIPTPDYYLAQDLYNEVDTLQTRIAILTEAVKVVGVYNGEAEGVKRVFQEGTENDLIPVDNWAMFAEKGGLKGQIDWVPIVDIVNALDKLRSIRDETLSLLQQVTGMADVMRGSLDNQYEGVGQSKIKANFGSVRVQALQETFAKFVSDLMQLKAEVICRHFEPQTILEQSNILYSPDRDLAPQAVQLLKSQDKLRFRVQIKPEALAQRDYGLLKQERTEYLQGLSGFLQAAGGLIQQDRRSVPFLLEMLKWAMAGFKGSDEIEGVLDKAIEAMRQPQNQEQKPDPEQIRSETQIKLEQIRMQAKQQELQMKQQNDLAMREADKQADVYTRQAEHQLAAQLAQLEAQLELQKFAAKMEADVRTEMLTSQINAEQAATVAQSEIEKEIIRGRMEIEKLKMQKGLDYQIEMDKATFDAETRGAEAAFKRDQAREEKTADLQLAAEELKQKAKSEDSDDAK